MLVHIAVFTNNPRALEHQGDRGSTIGRSLSHLSFHAASIDGSQGVVQEKEGTVYSEVLYVAEELTESGRKLDRKVG